MCKRSKGFRQGVWLIDALEGGRGGDEGVFRFCIPCEDGMGGYGGARNGA